MIETKNLIKQNWGSFLAIGGSGQTIKDLDCSLFNFGGINSALKNLGDENFNYLLISEEKYIKARTRNMLINWPYSYKGKNGLMPYKLARIAAKKELDSIKYEFFLSHNTIEWDDEKS